MGLLCRYDRESPGFVLKFSIKESKVMQVDFTLDDKYHIREIKENKVILSEGMDSIAAHSFLKVQFTLILKPRKLLMKGKIKINKGFN